MGLKTKARKSATSVKPQYAAHSPSYSYTLIYVLPEESPGLRTSLVALWRLDVNLSFFGVAFFGVAPVFASVPRRLVFLAGFEVVIFSVVPSRASRLGGSRNTLGCILLGVAGSSMSKVLFRGVSRNVLASAKHLTCELFIKYKDRHSYFDLTL